MGQSRYGLSHTSGVCLVFKQQTNWERYPHPRTIARNVMPRKDRPCVPCQLLLATHHIPLKQVASSQSIMVTRHAPVRQFHDSNRAFGNVFSSGFLDHKYVAGNELATIPRTCDTRLGVVFVSSRPGARDVRLSGGARTIMVY